MHTTSVKLINYQISESYLGLLAEEFCGKMLSVVVGSEDTADFEFEDKFHLEQFNNALKSFQKKLDV